MTTTKALAKTTNCAFRAKKVEGHDQKKLFTVLRAGSVPPLLLWTGVPAFKFVPVPLDGRAGGGQFPGVWGPTKEQPETQQQLSSLRHWVTPQMHR